MKNDKKEYTARFISVKVISVVATAIIALGAANAPAQESGSSGDGPLEEVVVTGSLIQRQGYSERSPVQVVNRESFKAFAPDTINDIAKNLTVSGGAEFQNESGNLIGTSQFNVRGLGLGSTLTLINGRRAGVSTVADGGGNQFFDINQLPLSMVERIDILTDGASATYGSQAVAGVANIITRQNFEGLEISAKYTDASNTGQVVNIAAGSSTDRLSMSLFATYREQTRNDRTDFDWLVDRLDHSGDLTRSRFLSSTGSPGSYRRAVQDPVSGAWSTGPGTNTVPDPDCTAARGVLTGGRCRYDFADQVSVLPEENRLQMFSQFNYKLNDRTDFFMEGSFSRNRIKRTLGPSLYDQGLVEGNILIPASHPFNFFIEDPNDPSQILYVAPADWDNNIHQAVDLRAISRPLGVDFNGTGPDREIDIDYWRGVAGLDVELAAAWRVNFSYMYAGAKRTDERAYEFVKDAVNNAAVDGSWNPFGTSLANPALVSPKDGVSVAANSDDLLRSLWRTARDEAETTQTVLDLTVSGEWFDLPGGPVGVAVGTQYREEDLLSFLDPLSASGAGARASNLTFTPISGKQEVTSVFAEAILPLADRLEVQLALRHENYGDGLDTTDPKISARWQATDTIALRGSFGTSFQAPSVRQTSTSNQTAFIEDPASINPVTGQLECVDLGNATNTIVENVGSPDLAPQEADSYAFGIIFQPVESLDISVDYWRFDYSDLITPDEGAQAIVDNDCSDDGIPNDPRVIRDPGGQLRNVRSFFINAGSVQTDGLDLAASYDFGIGNRGDFTLGFNATWVNAFEVQLDDTSASFDAVGSRNFTNPFRSIPEWRANSSLRWALGNQSATAILRYIDSYGNDQSDTSVSSWTTLDAQYAVLFPGLLGGDMRLAIGANNVLDKDPPSLGDRVRPGYDSVVHDVRGRLAYIQLELWFD